MNIEQWIRSSGVVAMLTFEWLLPSVGVNMISQRGFVTTFLSAPFTFKLALVGIMGVNMALQAIVCLESAEAE